jgi:hypothetical protein
MGANVQVNVSERMTVKRWAHPACVWLAAAGACGAVACDSPVQPTTHEPQAGQFVVSSPVQSTPSSAARLAPLILDQDVVYVSLPPGAIPHGLIATIRDLRTGSSVTANLLDGGFDPVALPATVGDTIAVVVQVGASPQSFQFAVKAGARPIVLRTDPPRHKRDVPLDVHIGIVFSEPIDGATLDGSSVQLLAGANTPVAGTIGFSDVTHLRVGFQPANLLAPSTDYQFIVTTAITDVNGLALDSPFSITFTTDSVAPSPPPTNLVFASLHAGGYHTCGVTTAGAAACWGSGQGLGTSQNIGVAFSPIFVEGGLSFAAVSSGYDYTCGLTVAGVAYCWGDNEGDQLAVGDTPDVQLTPVPVVGGLRYAALTTGGHTCALTAAGEAYC